MPIINSYITNIRLEYCNDGQFGTSSIVFSCRFQRLYAFNIYIICVVYYARIMLCLVYFTNKIIIHKHLNEFMATNK